MSASYKYICTECSKEFTADKIESNLLYLCPHCGKSEKNKPLVGVLNIIYDYEQIKKTYTREFFLSLEAGKIWLYPMLWPINFSEFDENILESVSLPGNQIINVNYKNQSLLLQDETRNPTHSYKDRATIALALKAKNLVISEISAASTGNAGSSLAGICARLGMKSHVFVPKNIPEAKRIQIQSYGSNIHVVDGDYDEAFDLCLEISKKNKWYNRNTAYNPLTIEGKKSAAFDIFINTKGNIPDVIYIPVGDGVIISGIYKGFSELNKLGLINKIPRLIAVQAEGSSAVVDYIGNNRFEYKPASTIADSISAGAPRNLFLAAMSVRETGGEGIKVSDQEILAAQKELAERFGILVEPSCAAAFAGFSKNNNLLNGSERVMLLLTGSGLKDFNSLKIWNSPVQIESAEKLRTL